MEKKLTHARIHAHMEHIYELSSQFHPAKVNGKHTIFFHKNPPVLFFHFYTQKNVFFRNSFDLKCRKSNKTSASQSSHTINSLVQKVAANFKSIMLQRINICGNFVLCVISNSIPLHVNFILLSSFSFSVRFLSDLIYILCVIIEW